MSFSEWVGSGWVGEMGCLKMGGVSKLSDWFAEEADPVFWVLFLFQAVAIFKGQLSAVLIEMAHRSLTLSESQDASSHTHTPVKCAPQCGG